MILILSSCSDCRMLTGLVSFPATTGRPLSNHGASLRAPGPRTSRLLSQLPVLRGFASAPENVRSTCCRKVFSQRVRHGARNIHERELGFHGRHDYCITKRRWIQAHQKETYPYSFARSTQLGCMVERTSLILRATLTTLKNRYIREYNCSKCRRRGNSTT